MGVFYLILWEEVIKIFMFGWIGRLVEESYCFSSVCFGWFKVFFVSENFCFDINEFICLVLWGFYVVGFKGRVGFFFGMLGVVELFGWVFMGREN